MATPITTKLQAAHPHLNTVTHVLFIAAIAFNLRFRFYKEDNKKELVFPEESRIHPSRYIRSSGRNKHCLPSIPPLISHLTEIRNELL